VGLPRNFRLSPFLIAQSGVPFNITTGQDVNGDSIFNDRPAFASPQSLPQNVITKNMVPSMLCPSPVKFSFPSIH